MKVLVACEFSGIVREAFRKKGHDAWSCDLLPPEIPGKHILTAMQHVDYGYWKWDLVIAFPPCTHLAVSGARWFKNKRLDQQISIDFVLWIADLPVHRIAIENPIGVIKVPPSQGVNAFVVVTVSGENHMHLVFFE